MADTYSEIPLADNLAQQRTQQFEEFLKFDVNDLDLKLKKRGYS